jgi:transcriptional regulator with XRE-family HTH domain
MIFEKVQEKVAEQLGVDRTTYYRYESSYIEKLPVTIVAPLAKALKTSPAYLMGWDDTTIDERKFFDTYYRGKASNQAAIKVLVEAIDKLLQESEQGNDDTK